MQSAFITSIEEHPFFTDWTGPDTCALHKAAREMDYAEGEVIYDIGGKELGVFLILEGEVTFFSKIGEHYAEIDRRSVGAVFGDVSFMTSSPHRIRAVAHTSCRIGLIPAKAMDEYLGQIPPPVFKLLRSMVDHISKTTRACSEQLVQHQKLALLGGMVNSIVHDFKSPFQMINLGAEMIDSIAKDRQVHRLCSSITDQVGRMLEMSTELGEYSRGQSSFNFQRVNLRKIVDQFVESQSPLLSKEGFSLDRDIAEVEMDADPQKIMRLLQNLVSNAAESMPAGRGKVSISAAPAPDGESLVMRISDNGTGIPESIRDSFWNPFVTSGKPHGIGLGTSIVKSIVDGHGGTIDFSTETGKGTTFTITLPLFQTAVS